MSKNLSRRKFLKAAGAGLLLPAAGCVSTTGLKDAFQPPPNVVYRTLGKTGLKVSGVGYGIGFVPVTEVVARALDMGVNYFDTSRDYGDSEEIFSGIIKGRDRSKIVIATKSPSRRKADILKDLDTSLKALGTDYVDIWHLHARDTPTSIPDEALEAMQECKLDSVATIRTEWLILCWKRRHSMSSRRPTVFLLEATTGTGRSKSCMMRVSAS